MSLLMDALKKAEQAKQRGQAPSSGAASLPEPPSRLEILDDEFIAHAAEADTRPKGKTAPKPEIPPVVTSKPVSGGSGAGQSTAQNVFAAKQAPAGNNKSFAIAVGSATFVAVAGIGVYFWLQLQRPAPIAAVPRGAAPVPASLAPVAPPPIQTAESGKPGRSRDEDGGEIMAPVKAAVPPAPMPARSASPPALPEGSIHIAASKLIKPNSTSAALVRGFNALSAGNLITARSDYERVLKEDPRNADALHGMAAIALREGRPDAAEAYYLRAIEADPKDAIALAGLIGLKGESAPPATESHLKNMLADQPGQPSLHFALGNLYARQDRWSEAQQSYFRAVSHDPDHPDYLFNLAISLDQLRQGKLAAQYYRQALAATAGRPAGFDKAQAETRLRELQP
ncbi:MAG: tetratricopeptide repeat protein [Candidatus Nitricoxidivorans perseverans]|uniref:Tetratricopeptide repeat protein n=1 Tax=Candidatus Nitricoxidivorans perseverans TaxID=2975601 RepID=A0AA49J0E2_9PROT|nr:MAG: tetratricopeptide repeat protein [Candidatus Nitricoxidivorans perseverans]